jgi:hypothetical protein
MATPVVVADGVARHKRSYGGTDTAGWVIARFFAAVHMSAFGKKPTSQAC